MSDILLEATLLACPDITTFPQVERFDVVAKFLERLADLSRLRANCDFVRFWKDSTLLQTLHEENAYPFVHSLKHLFSYLDPEDDFQIEDANTLARALLERSLILEEEGDIADVVLSEISIHPALADERSSRCNEQLVRTVALAVSLLGDGERFGPNVSVALATRTPESLTAKYKAELIEHADGTFAEGGDERRVLVSCFQDQDALLQGADVFVLWGAGYAYQACVAMHAAKEDPQPAIAFCRHKLRFEFGSDFLPSASTLGFVGDPKKVARLLRACADILLNRNLGNSHWLRTGAGANDPQRMRGQWAALRHDLDDEFHLHYWRNGDRIEFANVVTHNNFAITK